MRLKTDCELACGRSARLMRTSTTSTPSSLVLAFTRWVISSIRLARWSVSTACSGTELSTPRISELISESSRPRSAGSPPGTVWANSLGRDDLEAGIGVDHEALLVAGDDLELLGFVVEQTAVDPLDVLDQRDLGVEPGLGLGLADDGAELADQHLLGRVDGVEGLGDQEDRDRQDDQRR